MLINVSVVNKLVPVKPCGYETGFVNKARPICKNYIKKLQFRIGFIHVKRNRLP
jgi:hypothetical protein